MAKIMLELYFYIENKNDMEFEDYILDQFGQEVAGLLTEKEDSN